MTSFKFKLQSLETIALFSLVFLLSQLILAGLYYVERISFLDAAFVLTKIINEGQPTLMVGRYGAILTQIWPWIGTKMGLSISHLMLMYSISFPVLYLAIAGYLYRIEQYSWVIVLFFYMLLFNTESYFWTNNEIHQAIALFCLGIGMFDFYRDSASTKKFRTFVASLFIGLSILTHPLMLIVIAFYIIIDFLHNQKRIQSKETIFLYSLIFFFGVIKFVLSQANWYDGQKIDSIKNANFSSLMYISKDTEFILFFKELPIIYPMACVGIIFCLAGVFSKILRTFSFVSIAFILIYVGLVGLVVDVYTRFYIESQYMLISFFIILPLVLNFEKFCSSTRKIFGIYCIVSILCWWIQFSHFSKSFSQRVEWFYSKIEILQSNDAQKAILSGLTDKEKIVLKMSWGIPSESLLLSSLKGKSRTLILDEHMKSSPNDDIYHDCFEIRPHSYLNPQYFLIEKDIQYISWDSLIVGHSQ